MHFHLPGGWVYIDNIKLKLRLQAKDLWHSCKDEAEVIRTSLQFRDMFKAFRTNLTLCFNNGRQCAGCYEQGELMLIADWPNEGHFTHETESPWPFHFKHSHWWKGRSRSNFASHYAWGTNGICECNMDVKSTCIPTWHQMDHVSWSLGLFSKTTSWR